MKRTIHIVLFLFALVGMAGVARAQAPAAPAKDKDGYEQVDGSMMQQGETIPASRLVGAAYGFIFAAVVVWVVTVARRTRRLEDEVEQLRRKLGG
jgi:hypothetical protein